MHAQPGRAYAEMIKTVQHLAFAENIHFLVLIEIRGSVLTYNLKYCQVIGVIGGGSGSKE